MPTDDRELEQIRFVLDALPEAAVYPPDWVESRIVEYLYREGCLLVRNEDVERAVAGLAGVLGTELRVLPDVDRPDGGGEGGAEPGAQAAVQAGVVRAGAVLQRVTRLRYRNARDDDRPSVPEVLAGLEEIGALGFGAARPESVLYCCGHACPATEPEEVPAGTVEPFPTPARECDCAPVGGAGVLVGVVDIGWLAGADQEHRWLAGVDGDVEDPWEPGQGGLPAEDRQIRTYAGHGTFVAGCVRATAPGAEIYVDGSLSTPAAAQYEKDLVAALAQALDRSPDVVVFTFVTRTRGSLSLAGFDDLYETVIRQRKDLAFVAPAGNDGKRTVQWPAAYRWVLSVGALSADWRSRAPFSNFGGWVDVYAPGERLRNAFPTGIYTCKESPNTGVQRRFSGMATWSGTSFSTPLVAGMVAARMAATGENGRQATDALRRLARSQSIRGVGPVLLPGQDCSDPGCS